MQIIEDSADHLIIVQRRGGMAFAAGVCSLLSAFFVVTTLLQGMQRLHNLNTFQLIAWVMWLLAASGLCVVTLFACANMLRGMRVEFDRPAETVSIVTGSLLRRHRQTHSLYAVSHVDVVHNADVKVYGLFLILRPNQRIALGSLPPFAAEEARTIALRVRQFIRS